MMNEERTAHENVLPPENMSYETAKEELRGIVSALEAGSVPLEQTLEL